MTFVFKEFEDNIIKKLKEEKLIAKFFIYEFSESLDSKFLIKAFENSSKISHDERGVYIFNDNEEKVYCPPEISTSIDSEGSWLSDYLPEINFDIEQSGNVRKADEVEALYCCINISHIINEDVFKNEVKNLSSKYDFENMDTTDRSGNFRSLINSWQSLQSTIINIIISACKYKISYKKKNVEKFLRDGLPEAEVAELRDIEKRIRNVNSLYSKNVSDFQNFSQITKIKKLELIDERDRAISKIIKNSKCGDLYRLLHLSTEYISPVKKLTLQNWVRVTVDNDIQNASASEQSILRAERSQMFSRLNKKILKLEKTSIIKSYVEKYIQEGASFKFPVKL